MRFNSTCGVRANVKQPLQWTCLRSEKWPTRSFFCRKKHNQHYFVKGVSTKVKATYSCDILFRWNSWCKKISWVSRLRCKSGWCQCICNLSILKVTNQDAGLPVLTVQKGRNPRNPDPNPWLGQSSSCLKSGKILYSVQFQIKPKQCKKGRVGHQQSKKNTSKKILSILCFQQEL